VTAGDGAPEEPARRAGPQDASACATILNDWIDSREWMPRIHTRESVEDFYRGFVFVRRTVWVIGTPVAGFMALDEAEDTVTALYVATPGRGLGRRLLDHAKRGRDRLQLWTFVENEGARRFYAGEGFREMRRTPGDNEEGLPDVLFDWVRR